MKLAVKIYQSALWVCALCLLASMVLPSLFGLTPYVVTSGSMEPTIHAGAISYINMHTNDISVGDVVGFQLGDALVLHRLVGYDEETQLYTTRGDNNDVDDVNPISSADIIGRFVFSVPLLGYAIAFIQSSRGLIFCVGLLIISIVADILYPDEKPKKSDIDIMEEQFSEELLSVSDDKRKSS